MSDNITQQIKKGIFWTFSERLSAKIVQFILQLILARLLTPDDYGLSALILAFVNIANIFVIGGFNTALIQKKESARIDYSSVFFVSISFAVLLYVVLYICSPIIANFFNDDRIVSLLRVISISLIIGSYSSVQVAYLTKNMQFKKLFKANIIGVTLSAIISILMAVKGFGVWALVFQYLINRIVVLIVLQLLVKWHPYIEFSWESIKALFSYGSKCMFSNFLSTIVTDLYTAVIGKFYPKSQLGVYDTGLKMPSTVTETFTSALGSVLFPAFSSMQDDRKLLKQYLKKANETSSFIVFPVVFAMAAMAKPLILFLLTDKWSGAIPFMQIACLLFCFYPLHINSLQVINSIGKSDVTLKNEILKKIVDLSFLAVTIHFNLYWVAIGRAITSFIAIFINIWPVKTFLGYTIGQQLRDILPAFIISVVAAITTYCCLYLPVESNFVMILLQMFVFIVVYIGLSFYFNKSLLKRIIRLSLNR